MLNIFRKFFFSLFFTFFYMAFLLVLPLLPLLIVNVLDGFLFLILKIIDFFYWIFFFSCIKINSWWVNLIELYIVNVRYQPGETIKKGDIKAWSLIYVDFISPFLDIFIIWSWWLYFLFEDDFFEETLEEKPSFEAAEEEELALETPPEDVEDIDGEEDFALEEEDELEEFENQDDPLGGDESAYTILYPGITDDISKEMSNEFPVQSSELLDEEKKELLENDFEYEIFDDEFAFPYPAASLVEKCFWDFDLPEEFILLRFGWEADLFDQEFFVYLRQTIGFFFVRVFFNFLPLAMVEFFFIQSNITKAILKIPFFYNFLYCFFLLVEFLKKVFSKKKILFLFIIFVLFLLFLC